MNRRPTHFTAHARLTNGTRVISVTTTAHNGRRRTNQHPVIITSTLGSRTLAFDSHVNLTNDGRWAYTWDAENRLIGMTVNTNVGPQYQLTFAYDARAGGFRSWWRLMA